MGQPATWSGNWSNYNSVFRHIPKEDRALARALRTSWDSSWIRLARTVYIGGGFGNDTVVPIVHFRNDNTPAVGLSMNSDFANAGEIIMGGLAPIVWVGLSTDTAAGVTRISRANVTLYQAQDGLGAGTTKGIELDKQGSLEFSATKTGLTTNGQVWRDTTQKVLGAYLGGVQHFLDGTLFTQTNTVTVTNTTTETTLIGTGVGTNVLPVDYYVAGRTLRFNYFGNLTTAALPGTLTIRIKHGTTILSSTLAFSITGSLADAGWRLSADITCRTTGVGGTVWCNGIFELFDNGAVPMGYETYRLYNTATDAADTTASLTPQITCEWGTADAGNIMTSTTGSIEQKN